MNNLKTFEEYTPIEESESIIIIDSDIDNPYQESVSFEYRDFDNFASGYIVFDKNTGREDIFNIEIEDSNNITEDEDGYELYEDVEQKIIDKFFTIYRDKLN